MWIGGYSRRPPFAPLQHLGLVMLGDGLFAGLAMVCCRVGPPLVPAQPLKLQPLHRGTVGAGHEIAALVRCIELALDPADAPDRGRRDHEHLAPMREGGGARLGQGDRIAFLVG